jgi:hypothetical protein
MAPTFAPTETYIEPAAASMYGSACPGNPLYVGDGWCDAGLNSLLCDYDGGDCCASTCVDSLLQACGDNGFDCLDPDGTMMAAAGTMAGNDPEAPRCEELHAEVGDGSCDGPVNTAECGFDGGDCCFATCSGETCGGSTYWCRDVAVFADCPKLSDPSRLGDGVCDSSPLNTPECGFDAGDCCVTTCRGVECGADGYNCKDPSALAACDVEPLAWVGDGWCDNALPGYNAAPCHFDGGDCCESTCVGSLCGKNDGYRCIDKDALVVANDAPPSAASNDLRGRALGDEDGGDGDANVVESQVQSQVLAVLGTEGAALCVGPATACFQDHGCAARFALGIRSLGLPLLYNLWFCLEAHELMQASALDALSSGGDRDRLECIRRNCRTEYLLCQVDVKCVQTEEACVAQFCTADEACVFCQKHPLFQQYEACVAQFCTVTSAPTPAPSVRDLTTEAAVFGRQVDGPSQMLFDVTFSTSTVHDLLLGVIASSAVALGGEQHSGTVHVLNECEIDPEEDHRHRILLLARWSMACNLYDIGRRAQDAGALGVMVTMEGNDGPGGVGGGGAVPPNIWLPRDAFLRVPLFSITHATKDSVVSLMSRNGLVSMRAASSGQCDTMHASGVAHFQAGDADSDTCCAAADVVLAQVFFAFDALLGAREFPYCRAGTANLNVTCHSLPDDAEICEHTCRKNGVCEDGGDAAAAFTCAFGHDCGDCGPRRAAAGATTGRPHGEAVSAAERYLCESPGCIDALVYQYDVFHGTGNTYANRLRTLCAPEDTCAVPGFVLEYVLPPPVQEGGATCCLASRLVAARYAYGYLDHFAEVSPFATKCPLGSAGMPDVSCEWIGGELSGVPDISTYNAARQYLCDVPQCLASGVLEALFNDLLKMDRSLSLSLDADAGEEAEDTNSWAHFEGGRFVFDEMCRVPVPETNALGGKRRGLHVELCEVSPAFYFSVPAAQDRDFSCCRALQVVFAELESQGLRTHAPGSNTGSHKLGGGMTVPFAKYVVLETPGCKASFQHAVERQQDLFPRTYPSVDNHTHFEAFWHEDLCWLDRTLSTAAFKSHGSCCAATDVLISRLLWVQDPSLGQAYFPECPRSRDGLQVSCHGLGEGGGDATNPNALASVFPVPDEASFMAAVEILCELDSCSTMQAGDDWLRPLGLDTSVGDFCGDPCRCSSRVPAATGCGFHDGAYGQPFCYVLEPAQCRSATASSLYEGEAFLHCPLPVDSCQTFNSTNLSNHMCGPFLKDGTSVLVSGGETIESMVVIQDRTNVVDDLEDILVPWALEAALVSTACFKAHGEFLCHSRLKRCGDNKSDNGDGRAIGGGGGGVELRVSKDECERAAVNRAVYCHLPVSNSRVGADRDPVQDVEGKVAIGFPSHCDLAISPFQQVLGYLAEFDDTQRQEEDRPFEEDVELFSILGGDSLLRQASYIGLPLFADSARSPASVDGIAQTSWEAAFDDQKALNFVACPRPFVKNSQLDTSRIAPFMDQHASSLDTFWSGMSKKSQQVCFHRHYCQHPPPPSLPPSPSLYIKPGKQATLFLGFLPFCSILPSCRALSHCSLSKQSHRCRCSTSRNIRPSSMITGSAHRRARRLCFPKMIMH